jgi:hypothetical protein
MPSPIKQGIRATVHLFALLTVIALFIATNVIRPWASTGTLPRVRPSNVPYALGNSLYLLGSTSMTPLTFNATAAVGGQYQGIYPPQLQPVCTASTIEDICFDVSTAKFLVIGGILQYIEEYDGSCIPIGLMIIVALGVAVLFQLIQFIFSLIPQVYKGEQVRLLDVVSVCTIGANPLRFLEHLAVNVLLYTVAFVTIGLNEKGLIIHYAAIITSYSTLYMMVEMLLRLFTDSGSDFSMEGEGSKRARYAFSIWTVFAGAAVLDIYTMIVICFQAANNFTHVSSALQNQGVFTEAAPITLIIGIVVSAVIWTLARSFAYLYLVTSCIFKYKEYKGEDSGSHKEMSLSWSDTAMLIVHMLNTSVSVLALAIYFAIYLLSVQDVPTGPSPTCT